MKKLLCFVCIFLYTSSVQAHWDDAFDPNTGCVSTIVHQYGDEALDNLEGRNQERVKARITTGELELVPLVRNDESFLLSLFGNSEVVKYYENGEPWDHTRVERRMRGWLERWDKGEPSWWTIRKPEGQPMGAIGTYCKDGVLDLACALLPDSQRNGYMTTALRALYPYLQPLLERMECVSVRVGINPENERSLALLDRITRGIRQETTKTVTCGQPRLVITILPKDLESLFAVPQGNN